MRHVCVATLASLVMCGAACAAPLDTWKLIAGATVTHDDNLFRLPNNVDTRSVTGKSRRLDNITTTMLGLRFDKALSLQRFQFDYTLSSRRYETYKYLDFHGADYGGTWSWAITPRWHGTISGRRSETLAGFADYRSYSGRNIQRSDSRRFDGEWVAFGPWRLVAAVNRDESTNSQTFQQYSDSRSYGVEGGIKFAAASGSWISLLARRVDGRYLKRSLVPFSSLPAPLNPQYDTGFTTREEELWFRWMPSAKSTLDGRISRVSRAHDNFRQRDYSGYAGRLDYSLDVGGKLKLTGSLRRHLSPWQDYASSYYVGSTYAFGPAWRLSPKMDLRIQLSREDREYKGEIIPVAARRHDRLRSVATEVNWSPLKSLTLSASAQRERRASNEAGYEYEGMLFNLSGQVMF